jgi:hypothetical protein
MNIFNHHHSSHCWQLRKGMEGCTQAGEAAITRGGIASPLGTAASLPDSTTDSVTGITTQVSRAEDRKAAAAADTVGGSTAAVLTAGATLTEPSFQRVVLQCRLVFFTLYIFKNNC